MAPEYRKSLGTETWHSIRECKDWPKCNYRSLKEPPRTQQICKNCASKAEQRKTNGRSGGETRQRSKLVDEHN
jgi:hypothetical protein